MQIYNNHKPLSERKLEKESERDDFLPPLIDRQMDHPTSLHILKRFRSDHLFLSVSVSLVFGELAGTWQTIETSYELEMKNLRYHRHHHPHH